MTERGMSTFWLCACASMAHFSDLREKVRQHRRGRGISNWTVVMGSVWRDGASIARQPAPEDHLLLSPALRQRVDTEVIGFFADEVAGLYRALGVPYRRGVLLHGPPGNGKTTLIRHVGATLAHLPGLLVRPDASFDSDDMSDIIRRWVRLAPAILVIEDLNWILKAVNVSTFLNLLDGIEADAGDGLLLIATTNYPDQLDPAINNRPGRFDVVVEVPCPDEALRTKFLRFKLPEMPEDVLARVAKSAEGFAFAHLEEVLRLSGLLAIQASRSRRSADDLLAAAERVRQSFEEARSGFVRPPEVPFGLAARRKNSPARNSPVENFHHHGA